jgi:hypothetical protein
MARRRTAIMSWFILVGLALTGRADEPSAPAEPVTYAVSCKLIRKVLVTNDEGKRVVETISRELPVIATLEGTRGEYRSGGKVDSTPYGFQLEVKVAGVAKDRVRLEVKAEDGSAEGGGFHPQVQVHSLAVVRRVQLGKPLKLALDQSENGEGVWIELTVRQVREE